MTQAIFEEVLARVKPGEDEARVLHSAAIEIIRRLDAEAVRMCIDVYAIHVGSTARDTWLRGTKDIDIFLMFPPIAPREVLEEQGLRLAKTLNSEYIEQYAEHPYIQTTFEGFDVDLVPCYRVSDAACIKSAVDRSPFHNKYVLSHIDGRCDEARLLKQFLRGAGVYGSELKTQGFSGYLCELLIIHYGSFMEAVRAGANFRRGKTIDLVDHIDATIEHEGPLIVIDPVDPCRNVAAALSAQKFYEFIHACRSFLAAPSIEAFFPPPVAPLSLEETCALLERRGTLLLAITFEAPDVVEDALFPQLRKAEESVKGMMERHEFKAYTTGSWSEGKACALLFEMLVWELPNVERHLGPPVEEREHSARFLEKYQDAYIMGDRYYADISRKYTDAVSLIKGELVKCGLGKNVAQSIRKEYLVLMGTEALRLDEGLAVYMRKMLNTEA